MKLEVFDKTYDCKAITRTGKGSLEAVYITENSGTDTVKFGGIADMSVFRITGGDREYTAADLPILPDDPVTELQLALAEQYEKNIAIRAELTNTQLALTEIYEMMLGGVAIG